MLPSINGPVRLLYVAIHTSVDMAWLMEYLGALNCPIDNNLWVDELLPTKLLNFGSLSFGKAFFCSDFSVETKLNSPISD